MTRTISLILLLFFIVSSSNAKKKDKLIAKNAKIEKAGSGYTFTEGPAVAPDGKVYFTDQPNNRIHVWDENAGISLWLEGTGRSNGMYFNAKGQLVTCADEKNQLAYFDENKKLVVIHEGFDGKHLNAPNDLWIDPKGGIYFSDPYYHRKWWSEGHKEIQDTRGVYYVKSGGGIIRVIDDFKTPNGLIGTPNGKILYVADIQDKKIWKYDIQPDGTLANKTFFAPNGSDGMTIDNKGNVYLTSGKVWVYNPAGELIKEIEFPERPANICFGGKDRKTLFVTARKGVYTLEMRVKGVD
ncbi:MAG: SMP-30/gluconolactonase/LRE family protein [Draconibacterium sp.]|nr:SMP-30/gluconolactonase/LRE family protein [Draconibacterium sp.]